MRNNFLRYFPRSLSRYLHWITLLLLIIIVTSFDPTFLLPQNLLSLFGDIVPLFIMALGMTFVIYIGGIDLSAQSIANMTTVIATVSLPLYGIGSAVLCLLAGLTGGFISGLVTTRMLVPSFISTLAVGGIAFSTGQWLSGQRALYMDATLRDQTFGWMVSETGGIPHELLVGAVIFLLALFIERRTVFGRALKAVGAGELAASCSGIHVKRVKIVAFGISGMLAATAGLMFAVKLSGGSPTIADGFLLSAIVAVLVGGTPLTGGVGGVVNTLVGTAIVAIIRSSLLYLEIDATKQQLVFGLVLIAAIALTINREKLRIVK